MHRIAPIPVLTAVVLTVAAALAAAPAAPAAAPVDHFVDTFSYVDTNFCGTGESVQGDGKITLTAWDEGNGVSKVTREFSQTLVNPANGNTAYGHVAGRTSSIAVGDTSGGATVTFTDTGVRSDLRVPGQGVLTRDAGDIHYSLTFDSNGDIVDAAVLEVHGPHPDALGGGLGGGNGAYCSAAISALGL